MSRTKRFIIVFLLFLFGQATSAKIAFAEIIIIVSNDNPIESMELSDIRSAFSLRKRTWNFDIPVVIVVMESTNLVHLEFCKHIMNQLPYRVNNNWDRIIYTGLGRAPIVVNNRDEMIRTVTSVPGAIGYVEGPMLALVKGVKGVYEAK